MTSYAYELPAGKGKRLLNRGGAWNTILGGWQMNGIFAIQAGHPFTPTFNVNVANAGGTQRPDRIASGVIPYGDRTVDRWFDTKAFVSPAGFAFGNSGRNIITGPRLNQWDFSLFKSITVTERVRLQLRVESFNFSTTRISGCRTARSARRRRVRYRARWAVRGRTSSR